MIHCGALLVAALAPGARWAHAPSASRAAVPIPLVAIRACAAEGYTEGPTNYDEAEARGIELFQAGEHERAIRMFELAQTLPGDGVDYTREKSSGMIGSANASPNPRGLRLERYAMCSQPLLPTWHKMSSRLPHLAGSRRRSRSSSPSTTSHAAARRWATGRGRWGSCDLT